MLTLGGKRELALQSSDPVDALRHKVLDAIRVVRAMGMFEGNSGHVSLRVPGTRQILLPCHLHEEGASLTFEDLGPEHIVQVDLDNHRFENPQGLPPPDEYWIHTAVYDAHPEAGGVVHTHPDYPVSLSMADVTVKPMHHLATIFAPEVPIWDNHLQVDDRETSTAMVQAMGDNYAVVLRAHGLVTWGHSIEEAVAVSRIVDMSARRQYIAAQVGTPRPIRVSSRSWELGGETIENVWKHFLHEAGRGSGR